MMSALSDANPLLAFILADNEETPCRFTGLPRGGAVALTLARASGVGDFLPFLRFSAKMTVHFRQAETELTLTNYKRLSQADRATIESSLFQGKPVTDIARTLCRATATISREIRKHAVLSDKGAFGRITNRCIHRMTCSIASLCEDKPDCSRNRCSSCKLCNAVCTRFEEEVCLRLAAPPYVCNGCPDTGRCVLRKRYYKHAEAHKNYKACLSETREGVNFSEDELLQLDVLVSPLLRQGRSIRSYYSHPPQ